MTFLFQPYREALTVKTASLLRKEIQYLAEQHGQYCRLFKRKAGEIEAVFSQEQGYLLGETVWNYFEKTPYLIYCEKLASEKDDKEENSIVLVVVRDGVVYLDTKLTSVGLSEELKNLLSADSKSTDSKKYKVYTHGAIPYKFENVGSLKVVEKSVFESLMWDSAFQLLPILDALREQGLEDRTKSSLAFVTILCVGLLGALWWYSSKPTVSVSVNPYEQYELSLQTPTPASETAALIHGLEKINRIPGWMVSSVEFDGQNGNAKLTSMGGTATQLLTLSQSMGMVATFSSNGVFVNFTSSLSHRPVPDTIANTEKTVAIIMDRMTRVLPKKSVSVNQTISNRVFKQVEMTISFNNVSPEVLQLIGSRLDDLPVNIESITVSVKNGLLTGYFKISVVGN
ncbi:MAG TPA: hypothetical protein VGV92_03225 [Gammaproteobacteria bacterium]|nr:hypothetical protein [Gammaproteobacteria bacterium]